MSDTPQRLKDVYELMQEMSRQTDPQEMVRAYARRVSAMNPIDRRLSLSRRGLEYPRFRITRDSSWTEEVNPWAEPYRLPLLSGGLLAELIYSDQPRIIDDLELPEDDPAAALLSGYRSLQAIPMFDSGVGLNMVIGLKHAPHGFDPERLPDSFWLANLFGRATHNLVLREELRRAYEAVDRELQIVGDMQRSLLPSGVPEIPGLGLAAYYRTSRRAGGDYYDFFPLANGRWGFLVADVSGHGTPAAVLMAVTHSIAHLYPNDSGSPSELLSFCNEHLGGRYTLDGGTFVTAFYGMYNPADRTLTYASAGHNPPRWWRCRTQQALSLDEAGGLPLGISSDAEYPEATITLAPGDRLVLYTDGVVEAVGADETPFGVRRIDEILSESCRRSAEEIVAAIVEGLEIFTRAAAPEDDRTIVVASAS